MLRDLERPITLRQATSARSAFYHQTVDRILVRILALSYFEPSRLQILSFPIKAIHPSL
jgi:hypothetical protein